jgi:hypothetical protein
MIRKPGSSGKPRVATSAKLSGDGDANASGNTGEAANEAGGADASQLQSKASNAAPVASQPVSRPNDYAGA